MARALQRHEDCASCQAQPAPQCPERMEREREMTVSVARPTPTCVNFPSRPGALTVMGTPIDLCGLVWSSGGSCCVSAPTASSAHEARSVMTPRAATRRCQCVEPDPSREASGSAAHSRNRAMFSWLIMALYFSRTCAGWPSTWIGLPLTSRLKSRLSRLRRISSFVAFK